MTTDYLTHGVFPAMTTPFDEDEQIDHDLLAEDARRLEAAGVDGLVPVGSTGESATLTHDEHIEVVETVVSAVDVPVIAGSGSNSTHEAVSLSRRSVEAGADGLLLISPYYNKPEPAGMEAHYRRIADEVDVPQIIYNVPSRTGRNIAVETAVSLAGHENIVGYKAASGDLGRISEVATRTADEDFWVMAGDDGLTLPILSVGGTGVISVAGNIEPRRMLALVDAALDGDYESALSVHRELRPLFDALFVETNPIPVNAAMEIRGYGPGTVRSPLSDISQEHREELESILADLEEAEATV
ncbi:MAG: 4-hydroxy-tetrahydrodipicolinate synthase [Halodesulfurarchaeum sp.]